VDSHTLQNLRYRRQYVILPVDKGCSFNSRRVELAGNYVLYSHIDLKFTDVTNKKRLILLGDIFDYRSPLKENNGILNDLAGLEFDALLVALSDYTGRYLLIFQHNDELRLIHDSMAHRKIYYSKINGLQWFASQAFLLAGILNLAETKIPSKAAYYNCSEYRSNIGNTTVFDEIFQTLPNHYYDVKEEKAVRYWPCCKMQPIDAGDAAKRCSVMIKGFMKSITSRYEVMLPVTAGKDSRMLLSATRDITAKIYYYINKESDLDYNSNDVSVPSRLFSRLGLKFNIVDPYPETDPDFSRIYFDNQYRALKQYLPIIYNYHINFSDRINLPGEMAFYPENCHKFRNFEITPLFLGKITNVSNYEFALQYYTDWLKETTALCKENGVNLLGLFFWENRCSNYITQIAQEKDIAQDEIFLYNSRTLAGLFSGVDNRLCLRPKYVFFRKIIEELWPEVLSEPLNPSLRAKVVYFLDRLGIKELYHKVKAG
jgi:hypothetical protein